MSALFPRLSQDGGRLIPARPHVGSSMLLMPLHTFPSVTTASSCMGMLTSRGLPRAGARSMTVFSMPSPEQKDGPLPSVMLSGEAFSLQERTA